MKFTQLILREWKWWWYSPALWWSLPLLLFVITLYPPILFYITGADVSEIEGNWTILAQTWLFLAKQMLGDLLTMMPQEQVKMVETLLTMPIPEIWETYLLKPIQLFVTLPLMAILPSLGMRLLQRDLDNGFIIQYLSHRGSLIKYFAAKWLLNTVILAFFQGIAMVLFLKTMTNLTNHPEFFSITDPNWIIIWFGLSLGVASFSLWLCWFSFLLSRNGVTEIYNSNLLTFVTWLLMILLIKTFGYEQEGLIISSLIIWSSNLILLVLMSWAIRRERFWIH